MARFLVTVVDRQVRYLSKEFEAANADRAGDLADADGWTKENGWDIREDGWASESYIDSIESLDEDPEDEAEEVEDATTVSFED